MAQFTFNFGIHSAAVVDENDDSYTAAPQCNSFTAPEVTIPLPTMGGRHTDTHTQQYSGLIVHQT
jgi:hypothetical protein